MRINKSIIKLAVKKAQQSNCQFKISAVGINHRGEVIGSAINRQRFFHRGGGVHAEMYLMKHLGPGLKTIIICRVNRSGKMLPIHPCGICARKAEELGIKILTIEK